MLLQEVTYQNNKFLRSAAAIILASVIIAIGLYKRDSGLKQAWDVVLYNVVIFSDLYQNIFAIVPFFVYFPGRKMVFDRAASWHVDNTSTSELIIVQWEIEN